MILPPATVAKIDQRIALISEGLSKQPVQLWPKVVITMLDAADSDPALFDRTCDGCNTYVKPGLDWYECQYGRAVTLKGVTLPVYIAIGFCGTCAATVEG